MSEGQHFPWATGPGEAGYAMCGWCDRAIYLPALPCSTEPVEGLMRMALQPGGGARCQYELSIRRPDMVEQSREERDVALPRPYPAS